jgi:hypothetical protein
MIYDYLVAIGIALALAYFLKWRELPAALIAGLAMVAVDWNAFITVTTAPWWWPWFIPFTPMQIIDYIAIFSTFIMGAVLGYITVWVFRRFIH